MKKVYLVLLLIISTLGVLWLSSTNKTNKSHLLTSSDTVEHKDFDTDSGLTSSEAIAIETHASSPTASQSFKPNPAPSPLPGGSLKDKLAFLESAAYDGKPGLAYSLSSELLNCLNSPNGDRSKSVGDPSITTAERCRGLDLKDYKAGVNLLQYAASHGDPNAAYAYSGLMSIWMNHNPKLMFDENFIASFKGNTMSYLQHAAANGNIDAISQLAYIYQNGIITDRDPVSAYAYMDTVATSGLIPGASRVLDIWRRSLSPDQLSSALTRSQNMRK